MHAKGNEPENGVREVIEDKSERGTQVPGRVSRTLNKELVWNWKIANIL